MQQAAPVTFGRCNKSSEDPQHQTAEQSASASSAPNALCAQSPRPREGSPPRRACFCSGCKSSGSTPLFKAFSRRVTSSIVSASAMALLMRSMTCRRRGGNASAPQAGTWTASLALFGARTVVGKPHDAVNGEPLRAPWGARAPRCFHPQAAVAGRTIRTELFRRREQSSPAFPLVADERCWSADMVHVVSHRPRCIEDLALRLGRLAVLTSLPCHGNRRGAAIGGVRVLLCACSPGMSLQAIDRQSFILGHGRERAFSLHNREAKRLLPTIAAETPPCLYPWSWTMQTHDEHVRCGHLDKQCSLRRMLPA